MANFTLNGKAVSLEVDPQTPLLWVLREHLGLTGTKFGCGIAQCGACTVHLNGTAARTCVLPVLAAEGGDIVTIEGLADNDDHPLQQAWVEEQVPQCGYCQSGQIMQAADFLKHTPNPTDEQVTAAMAGNLCRCMAYVRIHRAVKRAANIANERATAQTSGQQTDATAATAGVGSFDPRATASVDESAIRSTAEESSHGKV
ncbi:(2Fe-2S)-binding protein [Cobetia sp. L2A1]|uniref:(2Fe-2S)-binding protein n=1 Tax=Cobetia sp. L2A1 TaxID=2686360 RepID=UPI00131D4034